MTTKLKPCPFCGTRNGLRTEVIDCGSVYFVGRTACDACGMRGPRFLYSILEDKKYIADDVNRRWNDLLEKRKPGRINLMSEKMQEIEKKDMRK